MTSSPLLLPAQPSCRHRRAPCRWEWIRKYCRTTTSLFILLSLIPCLPCAAVLHRSPTKKGVSSQAHQVHLPPIQQSYCWNEYEDLPSRAIASPVVVRGLCMVIYSRGSLAQVNATFYVTDVLKAPPLMKEYLEENPKVQLNFGLLEEWTGFPETADDVEQENLLRGQTCALQRVDLQREYLLFLRPRFLPTGRGEFPRGHGTDSEVGTLDVESGGPQRISGNIPRLESWSVFAAPEMATPTAVESVQKGLRQARRATVAAFRRGPVTQVKHGHPLSLQCRVKGFPRPRILWYKDGVRLDHRPPHRRDIHIRRKKKRTSILRIKKTSPGDSGTYRCVAVNVVGSSQAEVTVTVMPDSATESTTSSTTHWIFQGIPCQDRGFCQNEGVCSFYPRLMVRSCRCVYGFTGAQCEEQVPIGTQYVHYVNRTEQFNNGFQIFTFTTNTLLILLFIALIFFAYRIHRTLTSAAFESSASRSGSVYPGLTRQFSNDSRTQEAFLRVEYQHTSRHPVDERQSLLTVNHQTTIADNGNSNPNTAKCQPVESHAVPGRMKAQWKWPSASATVAMAADRVRHLSRSRPTVNVLPPSTAAAAPPTDQLSSAPNLSHLSSRAIGLPPYSERRPSAVDDLLLQTPSVPPV